MRGAPIGSYYPFVVLGIIPADAGSTYAGNPGLGVLGDHPRVCGEHLDLRMLSVRLPGSSPRMRGALAHP